MSRPLRIEQENSYHHVMSRGAERRWIFHDVDFHQAFLSTLEAACAHFKIEVHTYCLRETTILS